MGEGRGSSVGFLMKKKKKKKGKKNFSQADALAVCGWVSQPAIFPSVPELPSYLTLDSDLRFWDSDPRTNTASRHKN
jgi:hypothetical protein